MPFEDPLFKGNKVSMAEAQEQRRLYLLKSLKLYGFTEEQAKSILESLDEFAEEKKDLTEEAKDSLYKD
jgi:hypothetical protein